ncbi:hypothetical protein [Muriicola sp.]|uniref:hypothetical protein n=1 Tax=Muriicola sp. TaxID=2020856 RepID=UPI003C706DA6
MTQEKLPKKFTNRQHIKVVEVRNPLYKGLTENGSIPGEAASIRGNDGLRGYRNERFTGKSSFYQTSDLRFNFKRYKTGLIPVEVGIFGGFDVGRIWVDDSLVVEPAFNEKSWNTSVGGGVFVNGADLITANLGLFGSDDGLRFYFGFILGL